MKKLLSIVILLSLFIGLCACGGQKTEIKASLVGDWSTTLDYGLVGLEFSFTEDGSYNAQLRYCGKSAGTVFGSYKIGKDVIELSIEGNETSDIENIHALYEITDLAYSYFQDGVLDLTTSTGIELDNITRIKNDLSGVWQPEEEQALVITYDFNDDVLYNDLSIPSDDMEPLFHNEFGYQITKDAVIYYEILSEDEINQFPIIVSYGDNGLELYDEFWEFALVRATE